MDPSKIYADRSNELYDAAADKYGISSRAVLSDDPQRQYFRFNELVKNLNLSDGKKRLLELGCGNGEFYKFLNSAGFRGEYVGFDINEKLLAQARHRFTDIDVHNKNIMCENIDQRFDYVILSGIFNVKVGQTVEWIFEFLSKMYLLCDEAIAFNMISTHVTRRDAGMFYMDPAEVFTFCLEKLSKRTTMAHHNLPYNFTVTVFRNEMWESLRENRA